MGLKPRIAVSACVMGEPVRYNGGHCREKTVLPELAAHVEFVAVCPEVEAGLGVPRESMRLVESPGGPRLVGGRSGRDQTLRMMLWSRARCEALADLALDGFVLKKNSPSCGMEHVRVYHGKEGIPSFDGVGVFAQGLMARFPTLAMEEDGRLHDPGAREHFVTRVFASHGWRTFAASSPSVGDLVSFHARHALLLLAHDEARAVALGRLVADRAGRRDAEALVEAYGRLFLRALVQRPTRESQVGVMGRILEGLHEAPDDARADVRAAMDEYGRGLVPLTVPARILLHHVRQEHDAAPEPSWFAPWPDDIRLRTQIIR